jgi:alkylhydroperoxidase/carboxymuconolactone decarboxylase family protein YurZ
MTWCKFLDYAKTAEGIVAIVFGVAMSYILDVFPRFDALSAKAKRYIVLALCVALPVVALLLAWGTACIPGVTGEDVWQAVMAGGVAFAASQFAHARNLG